MVWLRRVLLQIGIGAKASARCSGWIPARKLSVAASLKDHPFRYPQRTPVCSQSPLIARTMTSAAFAGRNNDFIFRQLIDYKSYTFTYILGDPETAEAVIIDPVVDVVDRDLSIIRDLGLNLVYAVNTHVHADHITGSGRIKQSLPACKSVIAENSGAKADVKVKEGDKLKFGRFEIECFGTPGHTSGCMTFVLHKKAMAFTGDALLIRGCGRTDFQHGDASQLFESVHNKILSLPQEYFLYPAHDYTGQTVTTVAEETRFNPRLTRPKNEFIKIMDNLSLPYPKQIDKSLPANMICGVYEVPDEKQAN